MRVVASTKPIGTRTSSMPKATSVLLGSLPAGNTTLSVAGTANCNPAGDTVIAASASAGATPGSMRIVVGVASACGGTTSVTVAPPANVAVTEPPAGPISALPACAGATATAASLEPPQDARRPSVDAQANAQTSDRLRCTIGFIAPLPTRERRLGTARPREQRGRRDACRSRRRAGTPARSTGTHVRIPPAFCGSVPTPSPGSSDERCSYRLSSTNRTAVVHLTTRSMAMTAIQAGESDSGYLNEGA